MKYALALGLAAAFSLASGTASASDALTGPQVGAPAPAFSLRTLDGRTVTLDQYRGKTLVINVWATWCPPCREEMPDLLSAYPALHKDGVEFLGVDTTEEAPIIRAYVSAKGVPYPQALDTTKAFGKDYDVQYFPTTYVIDPQGILRARYIDVIAARQLVAFTAAAKAGKNADLSSPLQAKIDALLTDPQFTFSGNQVAIVAAAKKANDAVTAAEKLLGDTDAAKGNGTDFLRTRTEEAALRDRAIAALTPVVSNDQEKLRLASLTADAARDREQWTQSQAAYRAALQLDPKNTDALEGLAFVSGRLDQPQVTVDSDETLVKLQPDSVDALVELGIAYGKVKRLDDAGATFAKATALGKAQAIAALDEPSTIRKLAWAYLYEGRTFAKGGDTKHARAAFNEMLAWSQKLPPKDIRHDMYLEEGQEALVALDLSKPSTQTALSLAPWTGPELPGSVPNTIKYRLVVAGVSGKSVKLRTGTLPKGWVASFCTDRICAPFKVSVAIPASGVKVIEFQLVPPEKGSRSGKIRVIESDGAHTSSVTT